MSKLISRTFLIITCLILMEVFPSLSFGASKQPGRPVITSVKASDTKVTVKWKKAKRAKYYRVYVQDGKNKWKYIKKVKKTKKNKQKYSVSINYKIKSAKGKYKVYKRTKPFKCISKKTKARKVSWQGKYGRTYSFAVQAVNGKKKGKHSKLKRIKISYPNEQDDRIPDGEPADDETTDVEPDDEAADESYPAPMNIKGVGLDNMIWSLWYYPQVISDDTDGFKVFWGYAANDGSCGVAEYEDASGEVIKTALKRTETMDDHNGLAVSFLDDKRILCAYAGGHDKNNEIHIRISENPLDIGNFSESIVLESAGKTSYSQIIKAQGKYYLFYRVNSHNWGYRMSEDGLKWSDEKIIIRADMQYYCRFMPTADSNLIRIMMCSNPDAGSPEIRMGFLNVRDNAVYNSDQSVRLGYTDVRNTSFEIMKEPDKGKTQRLFDVAVTAPDKPEFLYAEFTNQKDADDSKYYLYDAGRTVEICDGGKPLMNEKYQLGASFIDGETIVAGRNAVGTDYIETYKYDGETVSRAEILDEQAGAAWSRNARPVVDVNKKAVLWHNGYYDPSSYRNFRTDGRLYLLDKDKLIQTEGALSNGVYSSKAVPENISKVNEYINDLYETNLKPENDFINNKFTWDVVKKWSSNWVYYSGLVLYGFLQKDFDNCKVPITEFYRQMIEEDADGNVSIKHYASGELDSAMPATGMLDLICDGELTDKERRLFENAVNYVYHELEKQKVYPEAGNLWLHSQNSSGEPRKAWEKWNVCLDGIYMSQIFLIHLAEAIEAGDIVVYGSDGDVVSAEKLWNDIYSRLSFVMENFRDPETGLLYHGYCVETGENNQGFWSRGLGWYTMVLLEAAESMPDEERRQKLADYYQSIMCSIVEWQDPKTFLWYNVTDGREELVCKVTVDGVEKLIYNIPETSASAMFAYCLLRGSEEGLLTDEEFRKAGMRAFNSLAELKLDESGLKDIYRSSSVSSKRAMYQRNGYVVNEGKGIGPLIMAAKYAE